MSYCAECDKKVQEIDGACPICGTLVFDDDVVDKKDEKRIELGDTTHLEGTDSI